MAYNQESSVETSIIKFKDQDFTTLRDHCLSVGQTFKDETFPAADSSIGQKLLQEKRLSNVIWKRPQVSEPHRSIPAPGSSESPAMAPPAERRLGQTKPEGG